MSRSELASQFRSIVAIFVMHAQFTLFLGAAIPILLNLTGSMMHSLPIFLIRQIVLHIPGWISLHYNSRILGERSIIPGNRILPGLTGGANGV